MNPPLYRSIGIPGVRFGRWWANRDQIIEEDSFPFLVYYPYTIFHICLARLIRVSCCLAFLYTSQLLRIRDTLMSELNWLFINEETCILIFIQYISYDRFIIFYFYTVKIFRQRVSGFYIFISTFQTMHGNNRFYKHVRHYCTLVIMPEIYR